MIAKATPAPMNAGTANSSRACNPAVSTHFGRDEARRQDAAIAGCEPSPVPPPAAAARRAPPAASGEYRAPLPPSRPPMIGALPTPMPPDPEIDAGLPQADPWLSAPILETRFVPLKWRWPGLLPRAADFW